VPRRSRGRKPARRGSTRKGLARAGTVKSRSFKGARPGAARLRAADLLLEIGTEEIPARFLPPARRQLAALGEKLLKEHALGFGSITTYATPRRLVLLATAVPGMQESRETVVLGPPKAAAFDAEGKPTPAAEGFARKHGLAVKDLREVPTGKGPRMAVVSRAVGRPALQVLPEVLSGAISGLEFPKSMRWPQAPGTFARPVRWLLALHGKVPVAVSLGEVKSGNTTRGRRFVHPKPLAVKDPADYRKVMARAGIIIDAAARQALIRKEGDALAAKAGGRVVWDEGLRGEVADLVEAPAPMLGRFPAETLSIPRPVIVAAMQEHQRYFPVEDSSGALLPCFVFVANGVRTPTVVAGNERVLKARLADARFFHSEDRKKDMAEWVKALKNVVWQAEAGSMLRKSQRVSLLSSWLASQLGEDTSKAMLAGMYSKADLVSYMVGEFPGLQGVAGGLYIRAGGIAILKTPAGPMGLTKESWQEPVGTAIAEHYRPQGPADDVPGTPLGCIVALADKVDTLAGHLELGHTPSGTADPYGLRRAAIGMVRVLFERGWRISLSELALKAQGGFAPDRPELNPATPGALIAFIRQRMERIFEEQGFAHDEIQASFVDFDDAVAAAMRLKALATLRRREGFREVGLALSRVTNIIPKGFNAVSYDPAALGPEERALHDAHEALRSRAEPLANEMKYEELYEILASMRPVIDRFFDAVLVMDKDETVRNRRLSLLSSVAGTIRRLADVRALSLG